MQALQSHVLLSSETHAMDQLQDFLRQRREAREPVEALHAVVYPNSAVNSIAPKTE